MQLKWGGQNIENKEINIYTKERRRNWMLQK
jgi:hypothetical protein